MVMCQILMLLSLGIESFFKASPPARPHLEMKRKEQKRVGGGGGGKKMERPALRDCVGHRELM